jgi:hypothetical protein
LGSIRIGPLTTFSGLDQLFASTVESTPVDPSLPNCRKRARAMGVRRLGGHPADVEGRESIGGLAPLCRRARYKVKCRLGGARDGPRQSETLGAGSDEQNRARAEGFQRIVAAAGED